MQHSSSNSHTDACAAHAQAQHVRKELLCYACALRMSMLLGHTPPPTLQQYVATAARASTPSAAAASSDAHTTRDCSASTAADTNGDGALRPVIDYTHHPHYNIVHETLTSVRRCLRDAHADDAGNSDDTTSAHSPAARVRHCTTYVCVACYGLYQFLTLLHAPLVAACVRASPYVDASAVSVNISVARSLTFTWLAAATYYGYKSSNNNSSDAHGEWTRQASLQSARPDAAAIVPEQFASFKDMYMSDLRAHVLVYLRSTHAQLCEAAAAAGAEASAPAGLAVYMQLLQQQPQPQPSSSLPQADTSLSARKRARDDTDNRGMTTVECTAHAHAAQAFTSDNANSGVIVDVHCGHAATDGVATDEACVPRAYGSNRNETVLTYRVVYEHVLPYLAQTQYALFAASHNNSSTEAHMTQQHHDDDGTHMATLALPCRDMAAVRTHVHHAHVYILGNYRKLLRGVSQSPWFTDGRRVGANSLQEVIAAPLLRYFFPGMTTTTTTTAATTAAATHEQQSSSRAGERGAGCPTAPTSLLAEHVVGYGCYKFHSAGREDVDVRMLGAGRPFVLELCSPWRTRVTAAQLQQLAAEVCASEGGVVEVRQLRVTDGDVTVRLARHSESKVKRYRCVVWSSRALCDSGSDNDAAVDRHVAAVNATTDLVIEQQTPLRVLHRRSLHTRQRTIHAMHVTVLNAHWLLLDVTTQAGTYVKEFVHGDLGRTRPHLGALLHARTDLLQLDVVDMDMQDV